MKILNASSYEVLTMNEKSTYCEYKKKITYTAVDTI